MTEAKKQNIQYNQETTAELISLMNSWDNSWSKEQKQDFFDKMKGFIENEADVNAKDKDDRTPLHWAAVHNNIDFAKFLLENGADVNAKDKIDWTPLHRAVFFDNLEIAKLLLENGADVFAKNNKGSIPLHWAAGNNNIEVAKFLLKNGANVNAKNQDDLTPLHLAADNNNIEIAKFLLENNAEIFEESKDEKTPYDLANDKVKKIIDAELEKRGYSDEEGEKAFFEKLENDINAVINEKDKEKQKSDLKTLYLEYYGKINVEIYINQSVVKLESEKRRQEEEKQRQKEEEEEKRIQEEEIDSFISKALAEGGSISKIQKLQAFLEKTK